MDKLSSTQIGTIAENHVANMLMITSGGRLSAFQPVADDDGIDLLIYDKKSGRALPAQVKSRTVTINRFRVAGAIRHRAFRASQGDLSGPPRMRHLRPADGRCKRHLFSHGYSPCRTCRSTRGKKPCRMIPRSMLFDAAARLTRRTSTARSGVHLLALGSAC